MKTEYQTFINKSPHLWKTFTLPQGTVKIWECPDNGDEEFCVMTCTMWPDKVFYTDFFDVPNDDELKYILDEAEAEVEAERQCDEHSDYAYGLPVK